MFAYHYDSQWVVWPPSKNGYPQLHPGEACGAVVSFYAGPFFIIDISMFLKEKVKQASVGGKLMRCSIQNQYSAGWS